MNKRQMLTIAVACLAANQVLADSPAATTLLKEYAGRGGGLPDANRGKQLWFRKYSGDARHPGRACVSCHTDDLSKTGKHIRTGKKIDPMAPSVNSDRLTDTREVRKWFKRNCKWTLGRECTASEKADLLVFIQQQ